jgi:hypothetical protein
MLATDPTSPLRTPDRNDRKPAARPIIVYRENPRSKLLTVLGRGAPDRTHLRTPLTTEEGAQQLIARGRRQPVNSNRASTCCCCGIGVSLPSSCPALSGAGQLGEKLQTGNLYSMVALCAEDLVFYGLSPASLLLFSFILGSGDCLRIQVLIWVLSNEFERFLLILCFDCPGAGDFEVFHLAHSLIR